MIHVDLNKLGIDIEDGLRVVRDLATSLLYAAAAGWGVTAFLWVAAVQQA